MSNWIEPHRIDVHMITCRYYLTTQSINENQSSLDDVLISY